MIYGRISNDGGRGFKLHVGKQFPVTTIRINGVDEPHWSSVDDRRWEFENSTRQWASALIPLGENK